MNFKQSGTTSVEVDQIFHCFMNVILGSKAKATLMVFSGGCNAIIALQPPESCCSVAT